MITLKPTVTKENFFNKMKELYPKAMEHFCKWIDEYKDAIGWNNLFNEGYETTSISTDDDWFTIAPKFHELPYDFQVGIWIAYLRHLATDNICDVDMEACDLVDCSLEDSIKGTLENLEEALKDEKSH